jgi:HEAT repeat protein
MRPAVLLLIASAAFAQNGQPDVTNARFESRAYSGELVAQLRAGPATWFGYAAKSASHFENNWCDRCRLEDESNSYNSRSARQPIALEGSRTVAILFRVEHDTIGKIRLYSLACPLDAGGLSFIWITGVPAGASLSLLEHFATNDTSGHLRDSAIFAISQHEAPEAIAILERLASPPQSTHVRGQAIFWLAQRAGEKAANFISRAIENDPDTEIKKKAVFALSQLPKDEGVPRLIQVARSNNNREVRKQAFFWLGQSQDSRALAFIEQVLER